MIVMPRTFEVVWEILQRHCGAAGSEGAKDEFLLNSPNRVSAHEHLEFRFSGALGFGGKIRYSARDHFYVDCYPEDSTPERKAMIDAANSELKALKILDHMDFNITDEQATQCLKTHRLPLYNGKNGLIVVRLDHRGLPRSYWHDSGYEESFFGGHGEYPLLFRTLKGAKTRVTKLIDAVVPYEAEAGSDTLEDEKKFSVVIAEWMHPDWQIGHPLHTKYSDIGKQFPGSPRQ